MTTDYRALCAELLLFAEQAGEIANNEGLWPKCDPDWSLLARVRDALTEPSEESDEDLPMLLHANGAIGPTSFAPTALAQTGGASMTTDYRALLLELVEAWDSYMYMDAGDATDRMTEAVEEARAALAQPEPVGPTDDDLLHIFYLHCDSNDSSLGVDHWLDEPAFLMAARDALRSWSHPTLTPIPTSERLPGPEDCDAEGRLWFSSCLNADGRWNLEDRTSGLNSRWYSHWLPAHDLPLPGQPAPAAPAP
jgi:hypothetical protein